MIKKKKKKWRIEKDVIIINYYDEGAGDATALPATARTG